MKNKILFGIFFIFSLPKLIFAYDPQKSARYDTSSENMFWFMQVSDTHIDGDSEEKNLRWILDTCLTIVKPRIAIATGDLTNGTAGLLWKFMFWQQRDEWQRYESVTVNQKGNTSIFFDIPGNHDRYGDSDWSYYKTCSTLGKRTNFDSTNPVGQFSKTVTLPNGDNYLFVGANTCDSTGNKWIFPGWGVSDNPELSAVEREYIRRELEKFYKTDPEKKKLSYLFGHAGIYMMGEPHLNELGEKRGGPEFVNLLNQYNVSAYSFGHTHKNRDLYDKDISHNLDEIRLINTSALCNEFDIVKLQTIEGTYRIIVVDNNGFSSRIFKLKQWPLALITSPLDVKTSGLDVSKNTFAITNPYAYHLRPSSSNFVRAVAFDPSTNLALTYNYKSIDSTSFILPTWANMSRLNDTSSIYQSGLDCSSLTEGEYNLIVKATSPSGECYDTITVKIDANAVAFTYPNSGEISSGVISLKATIDEDVAMAEMYYSTTGVSDWQKIDSTIIAPTERFIEIPFNSRQYFDLTTTNLWFKTKVTFYNGTSTEDPSDTCVIIDNMSPSIPTNFTVQSIGDGKIKLSWDSSIDVNLAGYKIYRAEDAELNTLKEIAIIKETDWTDSGLKNDSAYWYMVKAYDMASNESDWTNAISTIANNDPPNPVSNLTAIPRWELFGMRDGKRCSPPRSTRPGFVNPDLAWIRRSECVS